MCVWRRMMLHCRIAYAWRSKDLLPKIKTKAKRNRNGTVEIRSRGGRKCLFLRVWAGLETSDWNLDNLFFFCFANGGAIETDKFCSIFRSARSIVLWEWQLPWSFLPGSGFILWLLRRRGSPPCVTGDAFCCTTWSVPGNRSECRDQSIGFDWISIIGLSDEYGVKKVNKSTGSCWIDRQHQPCEKKMHRRINPRTTHPGMDSFRVNSTAGGKGDWVLCQLVKAARKWWR